mmetsp:Transcript_86198/g.248908  ORF Transcript_86198/g.248908 Transcript_86198/m.248908 type:complete len:225 (-) Transcript_86198:259-933(-)
MPIDVFYHIRMALENARRLTNSIVGRIDIPDANGSIFTTRRQETFFQWRPAQSVAFFRMPLTSNLRIEDAIGRRKTGMLRQVKDVNFRARTVRGDLKMILGHVTGTIDFTRMTNLHANFNLSYRCPLHHIVIVVRFCGMSKATDFLAIFLKFLMRCCVVGIVFFSCFPIINHHIFLGEIAGGHHEIILFSRRVGAQQQRVFLYVGRRNILLDRGKPLASQTGPF